MNKFRLALMFVTIAGLLSGCQSVPANRPAVTSAPSSTALIITVEAEDMTEEEYKARRSELIAYLIERGYILSEADLVAESTDADRLIRATFGAEGGFKLSVFNLDSQAVAEPTAVASYSYSYGIPASYYGDYYYYGFAPIPFYGYSSWPTYYYPIYPSYPVCAPVVKPIAPYCSPWASHKRYDDFCYTPTSYVNCGYRSTPHNQWSGRQFWASSGNNQYRGRRNIDDSRPNISTAAATRASSSPSVNRNGSNQYNPNNARTAGRGNRANSQPPRVITADNPPANASAADGTSPAPSTGRNASMPTTGRTVGRDNRNYQPANRTPGNGQRPSSPNTARVSPPVTTPATTPPDSTVRPDSNDNRPRYPRANPSANRPETPRVAGTDNGPRQKYPRANPSENRTEAPRVASPDSRPRNYTPNHSNSPRPANTANNAQPTNGANNARPANVANNARPANGTNNVRPANAANNAPRPANVANNVRQAPSSPSGRHQTSPQSNPAPRSNPAPQNQSSHSNSNQQTASSQRESSTARQANEH